MNVAWSAALLDALVGSGADTVVASPGSRSTPLVLAAAERGIPIEMIVDERAAGFYALGRAKVTGRPPILVCTSGTAGAHHYPAVIEAAMSRTPLIVLTADRPPELRDAGAPQTIDQTRLFGAFVRWSTDLGVAEAGAACRAALVRRAAQAVAVSLGDEPGPVHLNVPARAPLEPTDADAAAGELLAPTRFWPVDRRAPDAAIEYLARACASARRGMLVAGPAPIAARADRAAVFRAARALGFPIWCEATSQLRFAGELPDAACDALGAAAERGELPPADLIVELGGPPVAASYPGYVERCRPARRIVVAATGWPDPAGDADAVIRGDLGDVLDRLAGAIERRDRSSWASDVIGCNRRARAAVEAGADLETELVRAAVASLPPGALLCLGNSTPVRTIDRAAAARDLSLDVWSQRGASGIDGLIAGAAGAASAGDRPVLLLVGDVSCAHDIGSLAVARRASCPLVIAVIDNAGGRIFEQLPLAASPRAAPHFERLWLTPPAIDLEAAARAHGVAFAHAREPGELSRAVRIAAATTGCTLIRADARPRARAPNPDERGAGVSETSSRRNQT